MWLNQWSTGGGDALRPQDFEAAFDSGAAAMMGNEPGWSFVAGVDLGLTRDCSAIAFLAVRDVNAAGAGRIRLAHHQVWKPRQGQRVELMDVEDALVDLHDRFDFSAIYYDPWQAQHMAQRLAHRDIPVEELPPTGQNVMKIASRVIEAFNDRRLRLYECPDLKRDLLKLRVEERSYGYRLVSPRDEHDHGDLASAFGNAIVAADDLAGEPLERIGALPSADDLAYEPYHVSARTQLARAAWAAGLHPKIACPFEFGDI